MNVLVLGDCIATGQNCLAHIILGHDVNLLDFNRFDEGKQPELLKWYIEQRKIHNITDAITMDNMVAKAYKYKSKVEREVSWPNCLPHTVKNLSAAGETFQGMYLKLKDQKPDLVLLTDFSISHIGIYVNYNGKHFVKRDKSFVKQAQTTYDPNLYAVFEKKANIEQHKPVSYFQRKNKKAFRILQKYIQDQGLKYRFCRFHEHSKDIITDPNIIDCTHLPKSYTINNTVSPKKKLEHQQVIADYIQEQMC